MKILFVWSGLNGYMGDCWRELASFSDVNLKIVVDVRNKYYGGTFIPDEVMRGLDWSDNLDALDEWVPQVVFIVGWRNEICREAAYRWSGQNVKKILCFDMPWEWKFRKVVARFVLHKYLQNFDSAFVNGAAAKKYARWLGFAEKKIYLGSIATDIERFKRHTGGGGFMYAGRNAPEKGLDVLRRAYDLYRAKGGKWKLNIVSGISPQEIYRHYEKSDCFILPSLWEPWGVVLVEAAASGLPIICTNKCGARLEVVKENGLVVKPNSAYELAKAMLAIENMTEQERVAMGAKGKLLAEKYSCSEWCNRVIKICKA